MRVTLTGLLVAATLVLSVHAYGLWQRLDDPVGLEPEAAPLQHAPVPVQLESIAAPPLTAFAEVVERPLFAPTRRPARPAFPEEEIALEPSPEEPDQIGFSLVGIALSEAGRVALVRRYEDGKVFRVAEGGEVLGWTVSAIKPRQAVFRRGDRRETLEMMFGASSPDFPSLEPVPSAPETSSGEATPSLAEAPEQG